MDESLKKIKTLTNKMNFNSGRKDISNSLSVQENVKKMRKLNEQETNEPEERKNLETVHDQEKMEKWFQEYFKNLDIIVKFGDLKVFNDFVFWSGMINGVIQFVFKVSDDPDVNGVDFNYTDDIDIQNPKNDEIAEKIEIFFREFSDYWRTNILDK